MLIFHSSIAGVYQRAVSFAKFSFFRKGNANSNVPLAECQVAFDMLAQAQNKRSIQQIINCLSIGIACFMFNSLTTQFSYARSMPMIKSVLSITWVL